MALFPHLSAVYRFQKKKIVFFLLNPMNWKYFLFGVGSVLATHCILLRSQLVGTTIAFTEVLKMVCFQFFSSSVKWSIFIKCTGIIVLQILISWPPADIVLNSKCTLRITSILCQTRLFLWIERKFSLNELVCPHAHNLSMKIFVGWKKVIFKLGNEFESAWKTDWAINSFSLGWKTCVCSMFRLVSGLQIVQCVQCNVGFSIAIKFEVL